MVPDPSSDNEHAGAGRGRAGTVHVPPAAHSLLRAVSDGVIICDPAGAVAYMNPVAEVLTGWQRAEAAGQPLATVLHIIDQRTRRSRAERIAASLRAARHLQSESADALVRRDGLEYAIELLITPLHDEDARPAIGTGAVTIVFRDVTAQRAMSEKLAWHSRHDALTRLANRPALEARLSRLAVTGAGELHSLCHIDLDGFKAVNDSHGMAVGDELMRRLARSLAAKTRAGDVLARLGGDELWLLLPGCPGDKARMIAEGLRRHIEQFEFVHEGLAIPISASIGVVAFRAGDISHTDLLRAGAAACERAKEAGGGRVLVLDSPLAELAGRQRLQAAFGRLRAALDRDALAFGLAPLRRAAPGARALGELAPWLAGEAGPEPIDARILAAASRYQLLPALDRWAVKAAADALRLAHPGLRALDAVLVPVHARSLRRDRFAEQLLGLTADAGLPPGRLVLAIRGAGRDIALPALRRFVAAARHQGLAIALDGAGASEGGSLEMLLCLELDYLLLDAGLVSRCTLDSAAFEATLALLRIARIRRIASIARGVDSGACADSLSAAGAGHLAGPFIGEARPLLGLRIA